MPYNPSQTYHGGQLIMSGLSNLGEGLGSGLTSAISGARKAEEDQAQNQVIFNYAKQAGLISPEEIEKFQNGSSGVKNGIIAGAVRKVSMAAQQQSFVQNQRELALKERRVALGEDRLAQERKGFTPSVGVLTDPVNKKPFGVYQTGPKSISRIPTGTALPEAGSAVTDAEGNQIGVWNAKGGIVKTDSKEVTALKAQRAQDIEAIDRQIAEETGKLKAGDVREGDWFGRANKAGWLGTEREKKIAGLKAKRDLLTAPKENAKAEAAPPRTGSPREQAIQILKANGRPMTEANIKFVMGQLSGK